ncbi:MAG: type II toxin-antitoxin system RelE/ParE family toxin [Rhodospirillaceae bacterium]|nr:type II toxin-antitoxin system RelE/ParE family toxin [Rhodospirillaceae bacterium]
MYTILRSDVFARWLDGLADERAKARIAVRIISAEKGNFGDCAPVGAGISEMRVHFGPGYRMYFTRRGKVVYLLLCGGTKSTQKRDIKRAKAMLAALKE